MIKFNYKKCIQNRMVDGNFKTGNIAQAKKLLLAKCKMVEIRSITNRNKKETLEFYFKPNIRLYFALKKWFYKI